MSNFCRLQTLEKELEDCSLPQELEMWGDLDSFFKRDSPLTSTTTRCPVPNSANFGIQQEEIDKKQQQSTTNAQSDVSANSLNVEGDAWALLEEFENHREEMNTLTPSPVPSATTSPISIYDDNNACVFFVDDDINNDYKNDTNNQHKELKCGGGVEGAVAEVKLCVSQDKDLMAFDNLLKNVGAATFPLSVSSFCTDELCGPTNDLFNHFLTNETNILDDFLAYVEQEQLIKDDQMIISEADDVGVTTLNVEDIAQIVNAREQEPEPVLTVSLSPVIEEVKNEDDQDLVVVSVKPKNVSRRRRSSNKTTIIIPTKPVSVRKRTAVCLQNENGGTEEESPPRAKTLKKSRKQQEDDNNVSDKSNKYVLMRIKNNEASKRSRLQRKERDQMMGVEADQLEEKNERLRQKITKLEKNVATLKNMLMSVMLKK